MIEVYKIVQGNHDPKPTQDLVTLNDMSSSLGHKLQLRKINSSTGCFNIMLLTEYGLGKKDFTNSFHVTG